MSEVMEFGVCFQNLDAQGFVAAARRAQDLMFGTFWVPEDYFYRGAVSLASAILTHTTSLKVGLGVLNPYTRHPALTAMEFAVLDEISRGRAILGLGTSIPMWIEQQMGVPFAAPISATRESVELIRRMFRGERRNSPGQVFKTAGVRFAFKPMHTEIPIYLGVMGPKKLALAGEIADGLLLGALTSPAYVRHAVKHLQQGAVRSGRQLEKFPVGAYLPIALSSDGKNAREAVKPLIAGMIGLMSGFPNHAVFSCGGIARETLERFTAAFAKGEFPVALVTEEMVDTFAVAGTPQECRVRLAEFVEAGVTMPVAFELPGVAPEKLMRDIRTHLIPHFV
ncbi:MAG: LLM class flavin-dependent oxidoreductase [Deltaproteobacteria bacterium]|nr:LLM class flavin-dependent oxidoreductase [Deltaproteobacteria bacterium]